MVTSAVHASWLLSNLPVHYSYTHHNNPKAFWSYAKSRLKTRSKIDELILVDGSRAQTDKDIANALNDFFSSVFTEEDLRYIPCYHGPPLDTVIISPEKNRQKLKKLKAYKSQGPDGFHPRVLKESAEMLCGPLSIVFRKSLDSSILPEIWKIGNITKIHKKGSRQDPGNYRPVSLTSVIVKLMESIIRDAIVDHMSRNNLFADEQHGFVPGRSCMTQLLVVLEEWTSILQHGDPIDILYFDFKKAFDSVPQPKTPL